MKTAQRHRITKFSSGPLILCACLAASLLMSGCSKLIPYEPQAVGGSDPRAEIDGIIAANPDYHANKVEFKDLYFTITSMSAVNIYQQTVTYAELKKAEINQSGGEFRIFVYNNDDHRVLFWEVSSLKTAQRLVDCIYDLARARTPSADARNTKL